MCSSPSIVRTLKSQSTDIEDEGQSVTVYVPKIKTTASVDGKKEITTGGKVTIEDVVSYTNLIPAQSISSAARL